MATQGNNKEVKVDAAIAALQSAFEDMKKKVSDRRKEGYDTYIPELLLTYGPPQIRMFDASRSKDDYAKFLTLLREIDRESKVEETRLILSDD